MCKDLGRDPTQATKAGGKGKGRAPCPELAREGDGVEESCVPCRGVPMGQAGIRGRALGSGRSTPSPPHAALRLSVLCPSEGRSGRQGPGRRARSCRALLWPRQAVVPAWWRQAEVPPGVPTQDAFPLVPLCSNSAGSPDTLALELHDPGPIWLFQMSGPPVPPLMRFSEAETSNPIPQQRWSWNLQGLN